MSKLNKSTDLPIKNGSPLKSVKLVTPKDENLKVSNLVLSPTPASILNATTPLPTIDENSHEVTYLKEALKALHSGVQDAIVDIRVSTTETQEAALSRQGYTQLLQDGISGVKVRKGGGLSTTFGNKTSLWIWRRSNGTCSGRLKPIIDILLDSSSTSSDLVLSGYLCDPIPLPSGHFVWTKRASNEEEEKDAIIDLYVTTGKAKDTSDNIWVTPGVGWIRVDGNFTKSFVFQKIDSFLWYRPARTRSFESQMSNPIKGAIALSDEIRQVKLIGIIRQTFRHYIPVNDIKKLSKIVLDDTKSSGATLTNPKRVMNFTSLFHQYHKNGKINLSIWTKLLYDIGVKIKSSDLVKTFSFFDNDQDGYLNIEEFSTTLSLTDHELDLVLEKIRIKFLSPCVPKELQKTFNQTLQMKYYSAGSNNIKKSNVGVLGIQSIIPHPHIGKNKLRENLVLSHIFRICNHKKDNVLSLYEFMDMCSKIEIFLTEEESRKIMNLLDFDSDDRVQENDFIKFFSFSNFFSHNNELIQLQQVYTPNKSALNYGYGGFGSLCHEKKAFRVREAAISFRTWLARGTNEMDDNAVATASDKQWSKFKTFYEKSMKEKFPSYLNSRVLQLLLQNLHIYLSSMESRELTLLIAPKKSGRIYRQDIHKLLSQTCRSFGELIVILERDLFFDLIDTAKSHYEAIFLTGKEDSEYHLKYKTKLDEARKIIENTYNKRSTNPDEVEFDNDDDDDDEDEDEGALINREIKNAANAVTAQQNVPEIQKGSRFRKPSHEIISIEQLSSGLQDLVARSVNINLLPKNLFPNLMELAALAILFDAQVSEGDVYGVKLKVFLENMCIYILHQKPSQVPSNASNLPVSRFSLSTSKITSPNNNGPTTSSMLSAAVLRDDKLLLELAARHLKMLIFREARASLLSSSGYKALKKKPDYKSVFDLFDENRNSNVSLSEFSSILRRLHLVDALPDHLMPILLSFFDKSKKGYVAYPDFVRFADEGERLVSELDDDDEEWAAITDSEDIDSQNKTDKNDRIKNKIISDAVNKDVSDDDDESEDEDIYGDDITKFSGTPPATITRHADCDWLLWALYRNAFSIDARDPEFVLTELNNFCIEYDERKNQKKSNKLSYKDLWYCIEQLKLNNNINKEQFISGVSILTDEYIKNNQDDSFKNNNEDPLNLLTLVNYGDLCKYTIRMGRAYLLIQQQRMSKIESFFNSNKNELKDYFKDLFSNDRVDFNSTNSNNNSISTTISNLNNFTQKESLKNKPRFEKIFRRLDRDGDGMLDTREFRRALKILKVPNYEYWKSLRAIRLLFDQCDQNRDGLLSIKEFINYILDKPSLPNSFKDFEKPTFSSSMNLNNNDQRLSLLNPMTSSRNSNYFDNFDDFNATSSGLSSSKRFNQSINPLEDFDDYDQNFNRTLSDFEVIKKMNIILNDIFPYDTNINDPNAHFEAVRNNIRKFFLKADQNMTGLVNEERFSTFLTRTGLNTELTSMELKKILQRLRRTKGYETYYDYELLLKSFLIPINNQSKKVSENIVRKISDTVINTNHSSPNFLSLCNISDSNNSGRISNEDLVKILNYLGLNTSLMEIESLHDILPSHFINNRDRSIDFRLLNSYLLNYSGGKNNTDNYNTPFSQMNGNITPSPLTRSHLDFNAINTNNIQNNEKIASKVVELIGSKIIDRTKKFNSSFSLRKKLENFDINNYGKISYRTLSNILDELDIVLSKNEINALYFVYGKSEDDVIFYDPLCRAVDAYTSSHETNSWDSSPKLSLMVSSVESLKPTSSYSATTSSNPSYLSTKVVNKYRDLYHEGKSLRDIFMSFDNNHDGLIHVQQFKDIVLKFDLLTTENMIKSAIDDFSSLNNKLYINYDDFCHTLEKSCGLEISYLNRSVNKKIGIADGDGYDGFSNQNHNNTFNYTTSYTPMVETPHIHTPGRGLSSRFTNFTNDLAEEELYDPPSSRYNRYSDADNTPYKGRYSSPSRGKSLNFTPYGSSTTASISASRASPSKVGSRVWGNDTPLAKKGDVNQVNLDNHHWCCAVCLYVDNPSNKDKCLVCDSPNYAMRKDYTVKEQCRNCTFLNGQYADNCEMCGESLAKSGRASATPRRDRVSSSNDKYLTPAFSR